MNVFNLTLKEPYLQFQKESEAVANAKAVYYQIILQHLLWEKFS